MYTTSSRDHQFHPYASNAPLHTNGSVSVPPNHMLPSSGPSSQMAPSTLQPPPQLPGPGQMSEGGFSSRSEGRTYELVVGQQPVRARMCGFGDKDRRPITPPPCARLIVRDAETGKEIDINEIDMNHFVLTVDLWSADGTREVNLVRHSATSPSISAAVSSSYPPPPPTPPPHPLAPSQSGYSPQGMYPPPQSYPPQVYSPYSQHPPPMPPQHGYYPPPSSGYPSSNGYPPLPPPPSQMGPQGSNMPPQQQQQPAPSGMFTRNLIGSLTASAFRLTDPDNKIGIWFVLQDLSVRTEGTFRLKMNFVNVGINGRLNTSGSPVPILASVFSAPFQVYSAKKFPGVIESTELSKCFATQGMKIPIRKDGPKALSRGQDDDDDY